MAAEGGLTLTIHVPEPGSPSEEAMRLLVSWAISRLGDPTTTKCADTQPDHGLSS